MPVKSTVRRRTARISLSTIHTGGIIILLYRLEKKIKKIKNTAAFLYGQTAQQPVDTQAVFVLIFRAFIYGLTPRKSRKIRTTDGQKKGGKN